MHINIIYRKFLSDDGEEITIGGIQTYISMLSKLCLEQDRAVRVYQYAKKDFKKIINGIEVIGVNVNGIKKESNKKKKLFNSCIEYFDQKNDILIFACESMVVANNIQRSIAIQHGIHWDVKSHENYSSTLNRIYLFKKAIKANRLIKRIQKVSKIVCVDHNFINWYRSQVAYEDVDFHVIPNCTDIPVCKVKEEKVLKIIFARRLVERRGTSLIAKTIPHLLNNYDNIKVTIAGEGPELDFLKNSFKNQPRVEFMKYNQSQSLEIHQDHDIALVPTIGSEGTSLSLLEAMASNCAVIATNVGGMTNIILDNYNGLLIKPNETDLYESIVKLVEDKKLRNRLSTNAYSTVSHAFNKTLWEEKWHKIFQGFV
ncbi:glycosyltransferase family 4 protein [Salinicoccus siamensis]|uniref:Glycosyltransferase family 4 protein n=1 Tax=Salinicoccus siamensis TaxID=381830 RepID=A0ABV5Z4P9_9STAP